MKIKLIGRKEAESAAAYKIEQLTHLELAKSCNKNINKTYNDKKSQIELSLFYRKLYKERKEKLDSLKCLKREILTEEMIKDKSFDSKIIYGEQIKLIALRKILNLKLNIVEITVLEDEIFIVFKNKLLIMELFQDITEVASFKSLDDVFGFEKEIIR